VMRVLCVEEWRCSCVGGWRERFVVWGEVLRFERRVRVGRVLVVLTKERLYLRKNSVGQKLEMCWEIEFAVMAEGRMQIDTVVDWLSECLK